MTVQAIQDAIVYVRTYFESLEGGDWVCIAQIIGVLVFFKVLIHMILMHEDFYYKCLRKVRRISKKSKNVEDVEATSSPSLTPQNAATPEPELINGWLAYSIYGPRPSTPQRPCEQCQGDQISVISVPSLAMSSGSSDWDTDSVSSPMSPKPDCGMDLGSVIHDNYLSTRAQL